MTAPLTPPMGTYAPKLRPVLVMDAGLHGLFRDLPEPYVPVTDLAWEDLHGDLVRSPPATVVVVDPYACGFPRVHDLLRRFPSVPVVAAAEVHAADADTLLGWGVSELLLPRVERTPAAIARRLDEVHARPLKRALERALSRWVGEDARAILRAAAEVAVENGLAPELAERMGVALRTLTQHAARAGLPPPRRLQAWMRVLLASLLLDDPGRTVYGAAYAAGYRTDRSLRRAITELLGVDSTALRRAGAFPTAAAAFDRTLWEVRERERERRRAPAVR